MSWFVIIASCFLGMLVGSFLNVVALRFNTGKSLGGRSGCFSCGAQLNWRQLIPIFSWVFQKGRCHNCSSHISAMYVFGEGITALIFGLIGARGVIAGVNFFTIDYLIATLFLFVVFSILIVVFLYDIRHKIIPDPLSLTFAILAFISLFFFDFEFGVFNFVGLQIPNVWSLLSGIIVPLPFVILWIISKGAWLGLGDPKLMVGMGLLFGITQGFSSVFVSFWIGALFALSVVIVNKLFKKTLLHSGKKSIMKEEVPFAPFLIFGTLITLVFNINIF